MLRRSPAALLLFACTLLSGALHAADDMPPNIVFIVVDDLGWRDLSNEGSTFYESPNVDALAARGMKFTQGYAASRVCSPSRATILTGKYPPNHGITTYLGDRWGPAARSRGRNSSHLPANYRQELAADEVTLAEALKANGYRTFFAGKWHLGGDGSMPTDHGFDNNLGGTRGGGPGAGGYFSPYHNPNLADGPPGESLTLRLGQETADFIDANAEGAFFAFLSFYTVHSPIQTTESLWRKYRNKVEAQGFAGQRFVFDRRLAVRQVQDNPIYAGMIETMDDAVGLVLAKLEEKGLTENTIICFTSDNGGVSSGDAFATSNLPLRGGKGRQWEGGVRVPFYLIAPGVTRPGSTSDTPVHGVDWYPTLLDLAGLNALDGHTVDGTSLKPLLTGETLADRPLFWHFPHYGNQGGEPSSMIRRGDWKLIHYHEDSRDELYNLADDAAEQKDVTEAHPERTAELRRQLDTWLDASDALFPEADEKFDSAKREQLWERRAMRQMQQLESQHAAYLDPEYTPNKNWWGSQSADRE